MNELKRIVHSINRFDNIKECIHFLTQIKVFLIASDNIGQQIMLHIHHMSQFDSYLSFLGIDQQITFGQTQ